MRDNWFAQIPAWVLNDKELTTYEKIVYTALSLFADSHNRCYPTVKKLAEVCSAGETSVKAALKGLEVKGIITRQARYADGSKASTLYTLKKNSYQPFSIGSPHDPPSVATRPFETEKKECSQC